MSQKTLQVSQPQKIGKKEEALRHIITNLINKKQQLNKLTFTRYEIDQEVIGVCLVSDKRSIENKFSLLWRLGYLIQPKPNEYDINLAKVSTLEESESPKVIITSTSKRRTRTNFNREKLEEVSQNVIVGDQNCSTCRLIYPICGKKKRVLNGFCRDGWKSATLDNNLTQGDKK